MELYKELLVHILSKETAHVTFPELHLDAAQLVEASSYQTLKKIKSIIEDTRLDDESCFQKIEAIVCALEEAGSSSGGRHDFG